METLIQNIDDTETLEMGKYTKSFGLSFAVTSLFSALLVLVKESSPDTVLAWMAAASGHHWVTHGIVNLILFFLLGWLLARPNQGQGVNITPKGLVISIAGALIISWLIIAGFYLVE